MQKKLLKSLALILVIPGLLMLFACAETEVQSTTPDAPKAQLTDDGKAAADEEAAQEAAQRAIEEDAIRKALEAFTGEDIYFDYDQSSLTSEAQAILQNKAVWLRNNAEVSVVIEGHCDERGTTEYNLALGDRRANSAKSFLVDMGIAPSRLKTISYGEEMPVDKTSNESAWVKNRRAHFTTE